MNEMKDTMKKENTIIDEAISQDYKYGFVTDIEQETIPPGLNEDVIRIISAKKGEQISPFHLLIISQLVTILPLKRKKN